MERTYSRPQGKLRVLAYIDEVKYKIQRLEVRFNEPGLKCASRTSSKFQLLKMGPSVSIFSLYEYKNEFTVLFKL